MSVKYRWWKACSPTMPRMSCTSNPGVPVGVSRIEIPRCFSASGSVRTRRKQNSAEFAYDVQIFCPLTTYSSPSRTAAVLSAARSDPASGSEKPWHQMTSPAEIRFRW